VEEEVAGGWRRLHNVELNNLYASPNFINMVRRKRKMCGACSMPGEMRNVYRVMVVKPEGKRPLGRCRRRWVYNIRMDPKEIKGEIVDYIHVAQGRDQ
jgi:hypothetical protein